MQSDYAFWKIKRIGKKNSRDLSRAWEVKNYEDWEVAVGECEIHLVWLTGAYPSKASSLSKWLGRRGPGFRCGLEQAVNSKSSLEFPQSGSSNTVILAIRT